MSVAGKQRGMILKCEDCGEEIEINPEEYTGNTICPKCSSNNFKAASRSGCFFEMMRLLEETERERTRHAGRYHCGERARITPVFARVTP